ncbi:MAG: hypothetical protein MI922_27195, partial [Bacteroidales bacterium]|nr:hypothetical protein [Bacteroidales bacterium]
LFNFTKVVFPISSAMLFATFIISVFIYFQYCPLKILMKPLRGCGNYSINSSTIIKLLRSFHFIPCSACLSVDRDILL